MTQENEIQQGQERFILDRKIDSIVPHVRREKLAEIYSGPNQDIISNFLIEGEIENKDHLDIVVTALFDHVIFRPNIEFEKKKYGFDDNMVENDPIFSLLNQDSPFDTWDFKGYSEQFGLVDNDGYAATLDLLKLVGAIQKVDSEGTKSYEVDRRSIINYLFTTYNPYALDYIRASNGTRGRDQGVRFEEKFDDNKLNEILADDNRAPRSAYLLAINLFGALISSHDLELITDKLSEEVEGNDDNLLFLLQGVWENLQMQEELGLNLDEFVSQDDFIPELNLQDRDWMRELEELGIDKAEFLDNPLGYILGDKLGIQLPEIDDNLVEQIILELAELAGLEERSETAITYDPTITGGSINMSYVQIPQNGGKLKVIQTSINQNYPSAILRAIVSAHESSHGEHNALWEKMGRISTELNKLSKFATELPPYFAESFMLYKLLGKESAQNYNRIVGLAKSYRTEIHKARMYTSKRLISLYSRLKLVDDEFNLENFQKEGRILVKELYEKLPESPLILPSSLVNISDIWGQFGGEGYGAVNKIGALILDDIGIDWADGKYKYFYEFMLSRNNKESNEVFALGKEIEGKKVRKKPGEVKDDILSAYKTWAKDNKDIDFDN